MADHDPTEPVQAAAEPVAQTAPVEHTVSTVDSQPMLDVLEGLTRDEPQPVPAPQSTSPDKDYRPTGDIANVP